MSELLTADFMLKNETGKMLYHKYAAKMPIYDYHCHVSPQEIWEDKAYENITQAWLYGDHYKWRLMRAMGFDESYITGGQSDYDRFLAFAKTVSYCIGNPMYHWTHMELKTYFGINEELNEESAPAIWEKANAILQGGLTVRKIIEQSNVAVVCTTDDPADSLIYHQKIKEEGKMKTKVLPTFRPEKAMNPTKEYLETLSEASGIKITNFVTLMQALDNRMDYFHENGCRISDHSFGDIPFRKASLHELNIMVSFVLRGGELGKRQKQALQTMMMLHLGRGYAKRGWAMQLHIAALRNNNTRKFNELGADKGFDSIDDGLFARPLSHLLDALAMTDELPKTILYSLNPRDNYMLATMIGNFQGGMPGKMQLGSGWWFNDQRDGMEEQMRALANLGMLSRFVGMLTDSRSFLSYTRHDYFRRIMCNLIGKWVEEGEYPHNEARLGQIVQDICYNNAEAYFNL
ncbi:MAG: glucuronate isomerase [Clostridia bacterium]|nr:glucuronate isomerase [Clostridia bacterium]